MSSASPRRRVAVPAKSATATPATRVARHNPTNPAAPAAPSRPPRPTRPALYTPEVGLQATAVADAVRTILATYDDPSRPGLQDTPARVARMWAELLVPKDFKFTTFDAEGFDQMVLVRHIPFFTLCEHHMVPFYGHATVAYIPDGKIAGLSKLARAVDYFAHRLQNQERLTNQVAEFLDEKLAPQGVGVVMQAAHMCMAMRGVQKPGATTVTSALRGLFKDDPKTRSEFLSLAYGEALS